MRPFEVAVPQSDLDDLHRRLARTRLAEALAGVGGDHGLPRPVAEAFLDRWRHHYDWREWESRLNEHPQFLATGAGETVHLLHVRSPEADALPLVMTHGWPGSILEFLDVIGPLADPRAHGADPADAFHVVVPSMPGYGFSGPTTRAGVHVDVVAAAVADVMSQLGYERFVAQGGDWGALVTRRLGEAHAERVIGIHCNMLFALPADGERSMDGVTDAEKARMVDAMTRIKHGVGYMSIQSTKPQSLAYAQSDSPMGIAAWILEKFYAWSDLAIGEDGLPTIDGVFTQDQLLTNVMLYWLTNTAGSAARLYAESARAGVAATSPWTGRVEVPTGHAVYPRELLQTPRVWAEQRYNIVHWTEQPRGGHFAAFEQPKLFVDDIRAFGRTLRALR
ncbi:MAG TPA: epoxide hydrolase [Acidimicrobiales bacterium]|nr:epoxide hydrolase [Acidimicrobiales bacterium]